MRLFVLVSVMVVAVVLLASGGPAAAKPGDGISQQVAALQQQVSELELAYADLMERTHELEAVLAYVRVNTGPINGLAGPHVIFEGVNVHVRSGSGATDGTLNGLGNLLVGYNERLGGEDRSGSHNFVVGREHTYSSFGGFVAGRRNAVTAQDSSVSGGKDNTASGDESSVSGGIGNEASGDRSSVSGGVSNDASGKYSTVSGGSGSETTGGVSSVSGGDRNTASGRYSSVSGGRNNAAGGSYSSVSGGNGRRAFGDGDWVAGALWQDN